MLVLIDFSLKNDHPHKGFRHFPTVSDLSDLSEYVGLCRIMSDYVGLCCRIMAEMSGTFVGGDL